MYKPKLTNQQKQDVRNLTLIKRIAQARVRIASKNFNEKYNNIPKEMEEYYLIENHWDLLTKNKIFRNLTEKQWELYSKVSPFVQQRSQI